MHSYQHHIKDFNNATRHLTRVERALYRDAIELYYETEQPLPADDFDRLARRLLAFNEDEKMSLRFVLSEFFELTGDVYSHDRCDEEIDRYKTMQTSKARAGKASAEARKKKAAARKHARKSEKEHKATGAEHVLDSASTEAQQIPTNHEPETMNHEPLKPSCTELPVGISPPAVSETVVSALPTNKFNTQGEQYGVTQHQMDEFSDLYPAVDVQQALKAMRGWLNNNPTKRKTKRGMPAFINSWLARDQDKGGSSSPVAPTGRQGGARGTTIEQDLRDTSWAN